MPGTLLSFPRPFYKRSLIEEDVFEARTILDEFSERYVEGVSDLSVYIVTGPKINVKYKTDDTGVELGFEKAVSTLMRYLGYPDHDSSSFN